MRFLIKQQPWGDNPRYRADPGYQVEVAHPDELGDRIAGEMCNDEGTPFGVGATLTIERIA